jgi:hypothetical protein
LSNITIQKETSIVSRPLIPNSMFQQGLTETGGLLCKAGDGILKGVVISGIVNNSIVNLYDGLDNEGTILWSSGAMAPQTRPFDVPFYDKAFTTGLVLEITGANSDALLIFR